MKGQAMSQGLRRRINPGNAQHLFLVSVQYIPLRRTPRGHEPPASLASLSRHALDDPARPQTAL